MLLSLSFSTGSVQNAGAKLWHYTKALTRALDIRLPVVFISKQVHYQFMAINGYDN